MLATTTRPTTSIKTLLQWMNRMMLLLGLFHDMACSFVILSSSSSSKSTTTTTTTTTTDMIQQQQSQPSSSSSSSSSTVCYMARWRDIAIPWKKEKEMNQHRMEDIFLDEFFASDLLEYHHDNNDDDGDDEDFYLDEDYYSMVVEEENEEKENKEKCQKSNLIKKE